MNKEELKERLNGDLLCYSGRQPKFTADDVIKVLEDYENKIIPNDINQKFLNYFSIRDAFIETQGFALVTNKWIKPLAEMIGDGKCLEVMAGKGTLSYALQQQGVNVKATDNYSWKRFDFTKLFTDVENIDAVEAVKTYGKDIDYLIMSWPYIGQVCYNVVKELYDINPKAKVIYIGEPYGGCTACDKFFDFFYDLYKSEYGYEIDNDMIILEDEYKHWYGIHDYIYLFDFSKSKM